MFNVIKKGNNKHSSYKIQSAQPNVGCFSPILKTKLQQIIMNMSTSSTFGCSSHRCEPMLTERQQRLAKIPETTKRLYFVIFLSDLNVLNADNAAADVSHSAVQATHQDHRR
jgi:hypothetical protein